MAAIRGEKKRLFGPLQMGREEKRGTDRNYRRRGDITPNNDYCAPGNYKKRGTFPAARDEEEKNKREKRREAGHRPGINKKTSNMFLTEVSRAEKFTSAREASRN